MSKSLFFGKIEANIGTPTAVQFDGAPGWFFYGLPLTSLQHMAFGAGQTDKLALTRCFGEAAEILSITRREGDQFFDGEGIIDGNRDMISAKDVTSTASSKPEDPGNEGAAAGETFTQAWHSAAWEIVERDAVSAWWLGQLQPFAISDDWISSTGLDQLMFQARAGCTSNRQLRLIALQPASGATVVVAVTTNQLGHSPVLGFGAGPDMKVSAAKAISEALQMELSLAMALQSAATNKRQKPIVSRMRALERSHSERITPTKFATLNENLFPESRASYAKLVGADAYFVDLSRQDIGVPVARVIAPSMASARQLKHQTMPSPL